MAMDSSGEGSRAAQLNGMLRRARSAARAVPRYHRGPPMRRRAPFAIAAAVLWISACVNDVNPATGRREIVLMSTQDEQKLDVAPAEEAARLLGISNAPSLASSVDAIGQALAGHSPRRAVASRFQVVEMAEP